MRSDFSPFHASERHEASATFHARSTPAPSCIPHRARQKLEGSQRVRRRKLGRLRLGVEPIEEQLTRYRRVTWVLTAVPAFLSTFLFCLFAVFSRPDVGLVVAALLFLPICSGAWLGYLGLTRRARRYMAELNDYNSARERLQTQAAH